MLIPAWDTMKDAPLGYAKTFVRQLEGLPRPRPRARRQDRQQRRRFNPPASPTQVREIAAGWPRRRRRPRRGRRPALPAAAGLRRRPTANAYLGPSASPPPCAAGADVVVTGRVTDASVVVGPAIAHHGWTPTSYDEMAGAVVAGHVSSAGPRPRAATSPASVPPRPPDAARLPARRDRGRRQQRDHQSTPAPAAPSPSTPSPPSSSTRSSRRATSTRRHHPPRHDHAPGGRTDRVEVSGVAARRRPERLKVCVTPAASATPVEFVLTGLDIEAKADWVRRAARRRRSPPPRCPGR